MSEANQMADTREQIVEELKAEGWVIVHPGGRLELDYFYTKEWVGDVVKWQDGFPVESEILSPEEWMRRYRSKCKLIRAAIRSLPAPEPDNFTEREREVIKELSKMQELSEQQILRQALRLYQDHIFKLRAGETCTWSGDAERLAQLAGRPMTNPTPSAAEFEEAADRLKAFARRRREQPCKMLSVGDACECPLCDIYRLVRQAAKLAPLVEVLEKYADENNWHEAKRDSLGKWYYAGYEPGTRNGYELAQQALQELKK